MQQPLNEQERRDLGDVQAFNQRYAGGGYQLKDRVVGGLNLSDINLTNALLQNVHLDALNLSGAKVRHSRIETADLSGCDLSSGSFEDVQFTQCDLTGLQAAKAHFTRCAFSQCRGNNVDFSSAVFADCKFDRLVGETVRLTGATFQATSFQGSQLSAFNFFKSEMNTVTFAGCQITATKFSRVSGGPMRFQAGKVAETGLDNAALTNLSFEDISITNLALSHVRLAQLSIVRCPVVHSLRFTECVVNQAVIDGCPEMTEPAFYDSSLTNFCFTNSTAVWLRLVHTQLEGENSFRGAQLQGLDFSRSHIRNLRLQDCRISEALVAEQTTFDTVTLKGTSLAPGLVVRDDGAEYVRSDRFGAPAVQGR